MRAQFEAWLGSYKEFKRLKIKNTIELLDALSDAALQKGIINAGLFSSDSYISYAKKRQSIFRACNLTGGEKTALALLGDFYQFEERASVPYSEVSHSPFYDYCKNLRMSYSYKPVLLLTLLDLAAWKTPVSLSTVVSYFSRYYAERKRNGLIAERENSVLSTDSITEDDVRKLLISNPIPVLIKDSIIFHDEDNETIGLASQFSPSSGEVDEIKQFLIEKIDKYYSSIAAKLVNESPSFSGVLDALARLESEIEASASYERIEASKEPISILKSVWKEIKAETQFDDKGTPPVVTAAGISTDDPRSVGKLVREQMSYLAESGFVFEDSLFQDMSTIEWSKKTFRLYYPFMKIVDPSDDISLIKRDYLGNNRYWKQIFTFNNVSVLITSEWYKESKPLFIAWYNALLANEDLR